MPTPQPTKYERIAQGHVDSFQGTYHGSIGAAAIIVSVEEPTEEAKRALTASFKALGYSPQAIGWAQTAAPGKSDASGDLFTLIEGIDPFCVVSTSHASTEVLSRCYNTPLAIEAKTLLLGRDCRCFENLDALITTEAGKHKTWGLLKTLPKMQRTPNTQQSIGDTARNETQRQSDALCAKTQRTFLCRTSRKAKP